MRKKQVIISNEDLLPEEFREVFRELTKKIRNLVQVSVCKYLSGGFSESIPLLVYAIYETTQSYQVFKFGKSIIIDAEARNWKNYIENGPYPHANVIHLKVHVRGDTQSLIVYNFASSMSGGDPITFAEFYERNLNPQLTIKNVFDSILMPLSQAVQKKINHLEISKILKLSTDNISKITKEVRKLSYQNDIEKKPKVKINGEELYNPLYFYPFNNAQMVVKRAFYIPQGIIHGDLNAKNILFYKTKGFITEGKTSKEVVVEIPCIIDYFYTGENSLYIDIAKLESVLKFQILNIDKVDQESLLIFESENILSGLTPSNNPSITDTSLQKIFSCIEVLRDIAARITGNNTSIGYWLELYRNTLLHIKYSISEYQKRYAFFSAACILRNHLC